MKKIYIVCALMMHLTPLLAHPEPGDPLDELYFPEFDTAEDVDRLAQANTRRIRIKSFNKVTTGELVVNSRAYIENATVQKNLYLSTPTGGALILQNGLVTTGQIPASAIPNGAITNAKIASNAIATFNIAPMSITPDLLAFDMVQTFSGEPTPLSLYRGSVNGTTGAGSAGFGFSSTKTATGAYTITINGPAYTSAASYQVFIQLLNATDPVTLVNVSGSQFTVSTVADHDFSFFTIGN